MNVTRALLSLLLFLLLPAGLVFADGHPDKTASQKIERTIAADPAAVIALCVDSGDVTVRGWDKNEVLARSNEVGNIEFKRSDPANTASPASKIFVWLADKDE